MTITDLKIPFSYFGGKRTVAPIIWQALGNIPNYIEPFAGSLSILLSNPNPCKIETVNDKNCYISNFFRAVSKDPDLVAKYADIPVNETDLHARHQWLISSSNNEFRSKMNSDPEFYDAKCAGYWVYGQCASVGSNWLLPKGLKALPMLSSAGGGINGLTYNIPDQFKKLYDRLKRVRVACGDWTRIMTPSITYNSKGLVSKDITGIVLDPPYPSDNRTNVYLEEGNIFQDVCDWAIKNGDNPRLRIVVCGYSGYVKFPDTWQEYSWKTNGGLSNRDLQGQGKINSKKEMIWFSPYCLKV